MVKIRKQQKIKNAEFGKKVVESGTT